MDTPNDDLRRSVTAGYPPGAAPPPPNHPGHLPAGYEPSGLELLGFQPSDLQPSKLQPPRDKPARQRRRGPPRRGQPAPVPRSGKGQEGWTWFWTITSTVSVLALLCLSGLTISYRYSKTRPARPGQVPVDQSFRDGRFDFTVSSITCGRTQLRGPTGTRTADGQFCLVGITVRNTARTARAFSDGWQRAVTTDNETVRADRAAGQIANDDQAAFLRKIPAGARSVGFVVFDIPAGAGLRTVVLHGSSASKGVTVAAS